MQKVGVFRGIVTYISYRFLFCNVIKTGRCSEKGEINLSGAPKRPGTRYITKLNDKIANRSRGTEINFSSLS